jgi:hypothetical protein
MEHPLLLRKPRGRENKKGDQNSGKSHPALF